MVSWGMISLLWFFTESFYCIVLLNDWPLCAFLLSRVPNLYVAWIQMNSERSAFWYRGGGLELYYMILLAQVFLYLSSSGSLFSIIKLNMRLIIALIFVLLIRICRLHVEENSRLITQQVSGEFTLKEIAPVSYQIVVQRFIKSFSRWYEHANALDLIMLYVGDCYTTSMQML